MDEKRNVYQVSGGPTSRTYADVFLKYGVALIGPGDTGPWSPERYSHDYSLGEGGFVGRFAEEIKHGDILLLRTGISSIRAVGLVVGEYCYLDQFEDVNGWDLQHCRRVRWQELPQEYDFGSKVFGANPTRVSRVRKHEVIDYATRFINSPPVDWQTASLPELPAEEPPLQGVPTELQGVVGEMRDIAPLMGDENRFGDYPSEDEVISHFVVPFLRSLGWPPERIAVKWRRIDIAVFAALPRTPETCRFVIEAKRLGAGVESALKQAKGYVKMLGVPRDIVVTDGVRYRLYSCESDFAGVAYANLIRLKQSAADLFYRLRRP